VREIGKNQIEALMAAVDDYIPQPEREVDKPFLMPVEDVFSISGRGTVATGRVEQGVINVNDEIEIVGIRDTQKTVITGVEMFRKLLDSGQAGDNIGALLRGTKREDIERGQVLCKPGTITPHKKFVAEAYILRGDNINAMEVTLIAPIAMSEGLRFAIREGGRTVGAGVVSKIVE